MESPEDILDRLCRQMAELMRQYTLGKVEEEAVDAADQVIEEAEAAAAELRQRLDRLSHAIDRAIEEVNRLARKDQ